MLTLKLSDDFSISGAANTETDAGDMPVAPFHSVLSDRHGLFGTGQKHCTFILDA
jgi:hypothetical protein